MMQLIPNTFGIKAKALKVIDVHSVEDILSAYQKSQALNCPFLVLGEGSNSLFLEDFAGIIAINKLKGIQILEQADAYLVEVGSGESWQALVPFLLERSIFGLENLALIPGTVGSAAIQNIGAYGVEFKQFAECVQVLELASGKKVSIYDGEYGYRDSIFKHRYQQGFVVTKVRLKLPKNWQPIASYGELKTLAKPLSAQAIYNKVVATRQAKLPDPKTLGNAGSFFKNPVISTAQAQLLQQTYPNLPIYPQTAQSVKVAAGWLIDQCGLKGKRFGDAIVHEKQALVIVNLGQATAKDIVDLAHFVQQVVFDKFQIPLEREVRFIGSQGLLNGIG